MRKNVKILLIAILLLFALWNIVSLFLGRNNSFIAQYGAMEDTFGTTLYLFKDETVIEGAGDGVLRPTVPDGERVHRGARIGALLTGDTDEGALHEFLRIQDRLTRLKNRSADENYTETVRTDEEISTVSALISAAASRGDMKKVSALKDELLIAKDEKSAADGQRDKLIALLEERQKSLSAGFGNSIKEIYSPRAGTLLLGTDGLEDDMTTKAAEGLTVEAFRELTARETEKKSGCKVLYNAEWRAAAEVDAAVCERLSPGQTVSLRLYECGGATEKAKILEISEETDGKCIVVFSSNRTPEGLVQCRRITADVIIARYEGLRIPKKAIEEKDGETGVYVKTVTEEVFKKTDVSYTGEEYAIIRKGEATELGLYDTVVY